MELKIRYENEMQTIELDSAATDQLWVSLSLEGEGLSQEEREKRIQEEWDKQYNRPVLAKKPEWADAFIAIRLDGESVREYAARIGADENNISQKLKRAEKKLKENYKDRQI